MSSAADAIRNLLKQGPRSSRALQDQLGISQATVSRGLSALGSECIRVGAARSSIYALIDSSVGLEELPVFRVGVDGRLRELGTLSPVRPEGFVFQQTDGLTALSEGLPWWLADMRPQGFLGRAFAQRHAAPLALPPAVQDWSDLQVLRALTAVGQELMGNLLLGHRAREAFLQGAPAPAIARPARPTAYADWARQATEGEAPGSSAGGEQPKFTAVVQGPHGPQHVLVKFSLPDANPVSARWRDLLMAEHLALCVLRDAGHAAAQTEVVDHGAQRFLEVVRFDREGAQGRRALHSLGCLDDEFVGNRSAPWPAAVQALVRCKVVEPAAFPVAALLFAFGVLIGNTDMHMGNLSFTSEHGRPYRLAPAYDMLPMGFSPSAAGLLRSELPTLSLHASVPLPTWRPALDLADTYLRRLLAALADGALSDAFRPCVQALEKRLHQAAQQIDRLG